MENEELLELLETNNYVDAAKLAQDFTPGDFANILDELDEVHVIPLCHELDSDFLADVLVLLDSDLQTTIINGLHDDELQEVMEEVSVEDTIDIIEDLDEDTIRKIAEKDEVLELLAEKNFRILKPLLASMNAIDIAEVLEEIRDEQELAVMFRILPKDLAADTFVEMDPDSREDLINRLSNSELQAVMDELFVDDTVDIIEEMPSNVVKRLMATADKETREHINKILSYPKDSAGSIMTVEYVYLYPDHTVAQAFAKIRKNAINKETIYTCYVTDRKNKLLGYTTAKDLLLADQEELIENIMNDSINYVHTNDDRELVASMIQDYDYLAIPVVDQEMRLVGIVTVDDAIDVIQKEVTEDIEKMAAITPSTKPYLKSNVFQIFAKRIPWLLLLMVSATFTGLILNTYEEKLNAISPVLFACVPMIMDTGGNSGSQASVTVIRSLAMGDLTVKDTFKVIWKELRVSLLCAIVLGIACFGKLMLIDNLLFKFTGYTYIRCAVVSLSLALTIIIAKFVGCVLPMFAKLVKLDPAVVASPFITTIVDALALMLFCGLSIAILA